MKKVKFLTTSAGDYGSALPGDEKEVQDSLAAELEEKGLVKITGNAGKDPVAEGSASSINIKDETKKNAPQQVLRPTVKVTPPKPGKKK